MLAGLHPFRVEAVAALSLWPLHPSQKQVALTSASITRLILLPDLLAFLLEGPWDHMGLIWTIQGNLPISNFLM